MRKPALVMMCLGAGCMSGGDALDGLWPANPHDTGPTVVWDMFAEPLPEIPFPNDVGTRPDLTSASGRRVNISTHAVTRHESNLRRLANGLEGFGTYAPMWIRFDERIDLTELLRVQRNADATDDAIYLVSLNPESANYGQAMMLDMGDGRFPVTLERTSRFMNDPRGMSSNILFETEAEVDLDGDGDLDLDEDTDGDGVWDRPNLWGEVTGDPSQLDRFRDIISFYELETDTLIFRSVFPLEQLSTYAVVVTRNLVGQESQSPVRSPFAAVNHIQQTPALMPLLEDGILQGLGIEPEDLAFAWTFTTQAITDDLEALRAGLHGVGKFSRLASQFPPQLTRLDQVEESERSANVYVLKTERILSALGREELLGLLELTTETADATFSGYRNFIEYFIMAEFEGPAFLENEDGVIRMNRVTGDAEYERATLKMFCAIPKARAGFQQPFPVLFYAHGYGSARFEMMGFAGSIGRFGIATCGIDAYGHGLPDSDVIKVLADAVLADVDLQRFGTKLFDGRARDLNGDGAADSGGDFWTANSFHTRDVVRQTAVDYFQAIRVLKHFGKTTMPVDIDGDGEQEIAGDFDANGVPDIGGNVPYFIFGQSLGSIVSAVVAPLEPAVVASAPTSGGGGLVDVAVRTQESGVVRAAFLPLFGPIIATRPGTSGRIDMVMDIVDVNQERPIRFARIPDPIAGKLDELEVGDHVRVTNLDNGETDEVVVGLSDPVGLVRLHIPADYLDRFQVELLRRNATAPYRTINTWETPDLEEAAFRGENYLVGDTLRLLQEGHGHRRGTPSLRRLMSLAQMISDPADPVNVALLHNEPIFVRPEGKVPTNLLVVNTVGDMSVPINTGVSIARAAGLIGVRQPDPRFGKTQDQVLIDSWVLEGLEGLTRFATDPCRNDSRDILFDIDDLAEGNDPVLPPRLTTLSLAAECDGSVSAPAKCDACAVLPPLRVTRTYPWGMSGMRIPYMLSTGDHGFMPPDPNLAFDYNTYMINQIGWFFATGGTVIVDDVCLVDSSCDFLP